MISDKNPKAANASKARGQQPAAESPTQQVQEPVMKPAEREVVVVDTKPTVTAETVHDAGPCLSAEFAAFCEQRGISTEEATVRLGLCAKSEASPEAEEPAEAAQPKEPVEMRVNHALHNLSSGIFNMFKQPAPVPEPA